MIRFGTLAVLLVLVSCKSSSSIVGEWKLHEMDLGMEIPQEQQEMFEAMLQEMKDNTLYIFEKDGTIKMQTFVMGERTEQKGTYEVKDNMIITHMEDLDDTTQFTITDSLLIFELEERGTTMSMTFKKK